jgi:tetratricopeptide (TPR) repeat protein
MKRIATLTLLIASAAGCSNPQASQLPDVAAHNQFPTGEAELARHLALASKAETIPDRVTRCLQYPDLPGNSWPAGSANARCSLLLQPELSLSQIDTLLSGKQGGHALDRRLAALTKVQGQTSDSDPLLLEYSLFDGSEEARRIAEKWLALSPDSALAKTAVAGTYVTAGMDARGQGYIQETSPSQIAAMDRWLARAKPLLEEALQTDPRLSTACIGLSGIGRMQGNGALLHRALAICDRIDPGSWYVFSEREIAAKDKWGGNPGMRQQLVEDAKARMSKYPILGTFIASADAEMPEALADSGHWQEAEPGLTQAAMEAPNAIWLGEAGKAAHKAGEERKALIFLSQELRFAPDSIRFRQTRAEARRKSGDLAGAIADAQRIMDLGKAKGSTYSLMGQLMLDTGHNAEAKAAFQQAMQDPDQRPWAFHRWCEVIITREHDVNGALACTEGLLTQYPEDAEAMFMRAWVLTENKQAGADEMAQRFFAHANANDKREVAMLQQLHQLRGDK